MNINSFQKIQENIVKKLLITGNWKLNYNRKKILNFLNKLNNHLNTIKYKKNIEISIAPPLLFLETSNNLLHNLPHCFSLTAQNIDINTIGPFTGEISVKMIQEMKNVKYIIVGHSERRFYHNETNEIISRKFKLAKKFNFSPILCIGETIEEKNINKSKDVCQNQIDIIFKILGVTAFDNSVIAYEPIWAIGSGVSASSDYVQYMHQFIRNYVASYNQKTATQLTIQYGGSVNKTNAEELLINNDVDGLLIGNASLEYDHFIKIIEYSQKI